MTGPHLPRTWADGPVGPPSVGGCAIADLVAEFGSPLQVLDASDLDARATEYVRTLDAIARPARAVFATKALPLVAVIARFARHGIGADVTTDGEFATARAAAVDPVRIVHHGNGRSAAELQHAVEAGVGLVVLDGPQDVEHLDAVANRPVDVLVRLAPGVPPATHLAMATAHHGQKFGVTLGEAPAVFGAVAASRHLRLVGVHFHVGSQITALEPFVDAVQRVGRLTDIAAFAVLDAGGGLGVPLTGTMAVPTMADHVRALDDAMRAAGFRDDAELIVEPGRSLVARAGVTVYSVRTVKRTAGTTFVAVDGGTGDDLEAVVGWREAAPFALAAGAPGPVTVVGMHCDSGDVLARDVPMPEVQPGDLVVMPNTGAYTFSTASNYNCALRPAVVEAADGAARVLVRRETIDDLLARQTF